MSSEQREAAWQLFLRDWSDPSGDTEAMAEAAFERAWLARQDEVDGLRVEVATLRHVCGEAYQLVGARAFDLTAALDNLSAASVGKPLPHETFLPVFEDAEVDGLRAALTASQAREAEHRTTIDEVQRLFDGLVNEVVKQPVVGTIDFMGVMSALGAYLIERRAALADPGTVALALARVARASVARVQNDRLLSANGNQPISREMYEKGVGLLKEAKRLLAENEAAVAALLVVAPEWGEPREG